MKGRIKRKIKPCFFWFTMQVYNVTHCSGVIQGPTPVDNKELNQYKVYLELRKEKRRREKNTGDMAAGASRWVELWSKTKHL